MLRGRLGRGPNKNFRPSASLRVHSALSNLSQFSAPHVGRPSSPASASPEIRFTKWAFARTTRRTAMNKISLAAVAATTIFSVGLLLSTRKPRRLR